MQHLCLSSRRHQSISGKFSACQGQVRFFALLQLNHMLHRLCRAPSIHLSFNLAAVLPGGRLIALAAPLRSQGSQRLVDIVYGVDYQVSNPVCSPRFRTSVSVSVQVVAFATGVPSYIYAFHRYTEIPPPLPYSSSVVLDAVPRLSPGFHPTC